LRILDKGLISSVMAVDNGSNSMCENYYRRLLIILQCSRVCH